MHHDAATRESLINHRLAGQRCLWRWLDRRQGSHSGEQVHGAPAQLYGRRALLQFAHKIAFNARASRCLSLKPPAMQVLQLHEGFF